MGDTPSVAFALLNEGARLLAPVLEPHGFFFRLGEAGKGSGGQFAAGAFVAANRSVVFSVRYGLGLVTYRLGDQEITHEVFLRYSGAWGKHRYPDFGSSTAASFAALAHDLQVFFGDFISGECTQFRRVLASRSAEPSKFKGFGALSRRDG
jgi:hypothetical protein